MLYKAIHNMETFKGILNKPTGISWNKLKYIISIRYVDVNRMLAMINIESDLNMMCKSGLKARGFIFVNFF